MLWEVDILDKVENLDSNVIREATELGISPDLHVASARGYLLEGTIDETQAEQIGMELLSDPVIQQIRVGRVDDPGLATAPAGTSDDYEQATQLIHVLPKRGVTDAVAESALRALHDMRLPVTGVRTLRKYWVCGFTRGEEQQQIRRLCEKVLANDSIEQVVMGPLELTQLNPGSDYVFEKVTIPLRALDDAQLMQLSREGMLSLTLEEMQTIQAHFVDSRRDPTDAELETIAQTWSEHCSHKTLKGRIDYEDENGQRHFENMLKETIFSATTAIREQLGDRDWCVSVFEDNAGIVEFDEDYHLAFKVETHNRPSAIEPYGGANTGIGGVIRDTLGTGLGATPICNTDVFCFAHPDTPPVEVPDGVLAPRSVMQGVVAGVRDYGNRMGIPTVNGAVFFDQRYLGNPLVFCGNLGKIPVDRVEKEASTGDRIVVIGGRTGRDGIHGATFSSAELTSESEQISGGAVQIGNAITEKMVQDVLLAARDRGLYSAVTDCGAGGLSSAVGEMGERLGAEVQLEKVPLKYQGLSYTEIWISEAQERMVLAVPEANVDELLALCDAEDVVATCIGTFTDTQRLVLTYTGHEVANLDMEFLHDGRPPVVRQAVYRPRVVQDEPKLSAEEFDATTTLLGILRSRNVASKEWIIRQYDHEVQAGSVIKPLVGVANDGPSDAAVLRPRLDSWRGVAISNGMNPHYGDWDTYAMATSAIDEAIRNCVAVGADPNRIAILDNFCWGDTDRAATLGALVRAALGCHDAAIAFGTPFISGKDSLKNEFAFVDSVGNRQQISIPSTLLISAIGQVPDVRHCVTMDLKSAGNLLYLVGETKFELGGSHFGLLREVEFAEVPRVDLRHAKATFSAVHEAMQHDWVRACHDLSEGGLAVAIAEMAFAGSLGAQLDMRHVPHQIAEVPQASLQAALLFAESNSRFLCEIPPEFAESFAELTESLGVRCGLVGQVSAEPELVVCDGEQALIQVANRDLKSAWQTPLFS